MTWLATVQNDRPDDAKRVKLLAKRDKLVAEAVALKASPCGKSQAAINGRQEDLLAIMKKIKNIDENLGRSFA
jgi:hypothetical protein